jgi:hypothetical protein
MGTKGVPDTKMNWPTDRQLHNQPQLQQVVQAVREDY